MYAMYVTYIQHEFVFVNNKITLLNAEIRSNPHVEYD